MYIYVDISIYMYYSNTHLYIHLQAFVHMYVCICIHKYSYIYLHISQNDVLTYALSLLHSHFSLQFLCSSISLFFNFSVCLPLTLSLFFTVFHSRCAHRTTHFSTQKPCNTHFTTPYHTHFNKLYYTHCNAPCHTH